MEPDSLLESVREERAKYGMPLTNSEMGQLINAVAWKHRDAGWGLALKNQGSYTTQPETGIRISRDLLVHPATQTMYDVLIDVAGEGRPGWGGPIKQDLPFIYPVASEDKEPAPVPVPIPPVDENLEERVNAIEVYLARLKNISL